MPLRNLAMMSLLCLLAVPTRAETITLTTGQDDPPFTDSSRPDGGTATRLVMAVFRAMGVQTKLDWLPWRRGYSLTKSGTYRASFPYLETPEREQDFLFSDVIFSDASYLWIRTDESLGTENIAGFKDRAVCVPQGFHSPLLVLLAGMINRGDVRVERPDTPEKCVQMLGAGRVDALSGQESEIALPAEANGLTGKITHGPKPLMQLDFHVIFSKESSDSQRLVERFNQALQKMKEDGSYFTVMNP